jgi:hypothetical protein
MRRSERMKLVRNDLWGIGRKLSEKPRLPPEGDAEPMLPGATITGDLIHDRQLGSHVLDPIESGGLARRPPPEPYGQEERIRKGQYKQQEQQGT